MTEIIDADIIDDPGTDLEVRQPGGLFRTEDPAEFLVKATATASALAKAVRDQRLVVKIGQGEHVKVEGWTMLGSLLGVFPVGIWTRKLEDGWEARVEARTLAGQVVGAAEAECLRSEKTWASRDDYALRSMAQTRATSKALRMPLGFVMTLAGFDATPFEEMPPASELAAEKKAARGAGGLTTDQKKLYATFKAREEEGALTQGDLKALLTKAGAEELAHATPEQCYLVEGWLEVEVPFEQPEPAVANARQVKLLWTTIRERGVPEDVARRIVVEVTGQDSTRAIPAGLFEVVLAAVQGVDVEKVGV